MPDSKKRWRDLSAQEKYRVRKRKAKLRSKNDPSYKKFGEWVRSIRAFMKMSQVEFAKQMTVTELTVRRWELGWGHSPRPVLVRLLKRFAETNAALKKMGAEFEKDE
jgi:DNA-binding transcriptional regulator YiaG